MPVPPENLMTVLVFIGQKALEKGHWVKTGIKHTCINTCIILTMSHRFTGTFERQKKLISWYVFGKAIVLFALICTSDIAEFIVSILSIWFIFV